MTPLYPPTTVTPSVQGGSYGRGTSVTPPVQGASYGGGTPITPSIQGGSAGGGTLAGAGGGANPVWPSSSAIFVYNLRNYGGVEGVAGGNAAALSALVANVIAGAKASIYVPPGTWGLEADVTFPPNIQVWMENGAVFATGVGGKVTFNGGLLAPHSQIFGPTLLVSFGARPLVEDVIPEWFGVVADSDGVGGGTDSGPAIERMMAAVRLSGDAAYIGLRVKWPFGKIRSSLQWHVDRSIQSRGAGGRRDGRGLAGTILVPDAGVGGLLVDGAGGFADFQDMAIEAAGKTAAVVHGVYLKGRAVFRNFHIYGFKGNGWNIVASVGAGENANNWEIHDSRSEYNDGDGLWVDGTDVNAGVAIGLDCSHNLGRGIADSSYLGNAYLACHCADNAGGNYWTDPAEVEGLNTFVACYAEEPTGLIVAPSVLINCRIPLAIASTASTIEGYTRTFARKYTVPTATSVALFPRAAFGLLVVTGITESLSALLLLSGAGGVATIISDPNGIFTIAQGTAFRYNVYQDATYWRIENTRGGADRVLHVHFLG